MMRRLALIGVLATLGACASPGATGGSSVVPDRGVRLTSQTMLMLEDIVAGSIVIGAIHFIYDPLAPNWEVKESRLTEDTYRFSMTMKRHHTGGAGESIQIVKRRAAELQRELGYGNHQLLEYSEGIDSQTMGARRVAQGVVKLTQRLQADSFQLNDSN